MWQDSTACAPCLSPNIAIPDVGSNLWTYFYGQYGDLSRPANFERCLAAMLRYKHARVLEPDPERIRREFWQGEPSYARLFALFHQHYAERLGRPRWGDQTGLVERYADVVLAAYPTAKMIHMIRDPRDRYAASLDLWPNGKGRVGGATARWLYSAKLAVRNQQRYPAHYKIVRYETLVCHPEPTLREICTFLDEAYTPAMLTMEGAARYREKGAARFEGISRENPISTAFIGRYRAVVPKREIAFMQAHAGRAMTEFGYQLEPFELSLRDWLLFGVVDWPANLVRMLAWRTVEAIQHAFPGIMGRKPGARMIVQTGIA